MKVLVVEDDSDIAEFLLEGLRDLGYTVCGIAPTVTAAIDLARCHEPNVVILDVELADQDRGTVLPRRLQASWPVGFLFATGSGEADALHGLGANGLLQKPYSMFQLDASLHTIERIMSGGVAQCCPPDGFHVLR